MGRYAIGTEVSHFRLLERLGSGASGEVYRAEDVHLGRAVALKFLSRFEDLRRKESFLQEARLCASLAHPNIAMIYEIGWDGEVPFLAMELVEGEMLSRRIRSGSVTRMQAYAYMKQILEALEEAHSRRIVHRDIKSSNIMITSRDRVKILDFGLAREAGGAAKQEDGVGTLEFLAPEQARGEAADARSDLFSAGVVFYHMLSGRLPFGRETQVGTYTAVLRDRAVPLSDFQTNASEQLDAVLQKALAKDPARRYQTAREFLSELESLDRGPAMSHPAAAQPPSVAVLYFDRIGEAEDSEYLRLGITEDVITELAGVPGLRVLSRHAVQKYKDKTSDMREVARGLQAHYLLHGTVQKSGDRIRVSAHLIDGSTGAPVWTERFDRKLEDIFELQDDVSQCIAAALQVRLTDSEQRAVQRRSTTHVQAYEHFLRGRYHYNQFTAEHNRKAGEMLLKAVELDPGFVAAHAALSETYIQRYYNWYDRNRKWLKKAEEVLEQTRNAGDDLPEVHCTLGMLLYLRGEYEQAMGEIQKAIRLDPQYALAHDHTGEIYLHTGELDRAIVAFHTELRINPEPIYPYFYLVWLHSLAGDFSIAQEVLNKARLVHAKNPILGVLEGTFASYSGDRKRAQQLLGNAIATNPNNSFAMGRLAVTFAEDGDLDQAVRLIVKATEQVDPTDHHAAFDRGCVMAMQGEVEQSVHWLQRSIELGWRCGPQYRNEPKLASLRGNPEFERLLAQLNRSRKP